MYVVAWGIKSSNGMKLEVTGFEPSGYRILSRFLTIMLYISDGIGTRHFTGDHIVGGRYRNNSTRMKIGSGGIRTLGFWIIVECAYRSAIEATE